MTYVPQFLVTRFALIAIVPMLTVPLSAVAGEIHGQTGTSSAGYIRALALGYNALSNISNSDAVGMTAIGNGALRDNTTGSSNTAIGENAMKTNRSSCCNIAVGYGALMHHEEGRDNIGIGAYTLIYNRGSDNVAIGSQAQGGGTSSGSRNIAIGSWTLYSLGPVSTTKGDDNVALGNEALRKNRVSGSTAVGAQALKENTTGEHNTALGFQSLQLNQTGKENTASGNEALKSNTTGSWNTATGNLALHLSQGASANTATGNRALYKTLSGSRNTATGASALERNTRGSFNTAIGTEALRNNRNGSRNTAVGFAAGSHNTGSRNVFLGFQSGDDATYRNQSNTLVIANGPTLNDELISGRFNEHVVDINGQLNVQGELTTVSVNIDGMLNAQMVAMRSDGRLKKDIQPLIGALDTVLKLKGKSYAWRTDEYPDLPLRDGRDIGLVAQDVEEVLPQVVSQDSRGYKGIAYQMLTTVLIEAMKEQQQQITALQQENQQLKTVMAEQMDALLARVAMLEGVSLAAN